MNSITIITIVVVALLTVIIFGLTWLAYNSCIKIYQMEVDAGKHDVAIKEQYQTKKLKIWELLGIIFSYIVLAVLLSLFVVGIFYKAKGSNITFNNKTVLVIKSNSMSDFFSDTMKQKYIDNNYDTSLQFSIGDICVFETDFELHEGEVYGYKFENTIITHRLISYNEDTGLCVFQGDNNNAVDTIFYGDVTKDKVIYHYTGQKINSIGVFVLYAQSYFGIWSLCGIILVAVSSEIVYHKIDKINKKRNESLKLNQDIIVKEKEVKHRKKRIKNKYKREGIKYESK